MKYAVGDKLFAIQDIPCIGARKGDVFTVSGHQPAVACVTVFEIPKRGVVPLGIAVALLAPVRTKEAA